MAHWGRWGQGWSWDYGILEFGIAGWIWIRIRIFGCSNFMQAFAFALAFELANVMSCVLYSRCKIGLPI